MAIQPKAACKPTLRRKAVSWPTRFHQSVQWQPLKWIVGNFVLFSLFCFWYLCFATAIQPHFLYTQTSQPMQPCVLLISHCSKPKNQLILFEWWSYFQNIWFAFKSPRPRWTTFPQYEGLFAKLFVVAVFQTVMEFFLHLGFGTVCVVFFCSLAQKVLAPCLNKNQPSKTVTNKECSQHMHETN